MFDNKEFIKKLNTLLSNYCIIVHDNLEERWDNFNIEIYEAETSEVVGGLLARQATLTTQLATAPQIWNEHIAPLVLRSMADAHITLAWILQEPTERAKKYILYGLGQDKLYIEHLKNEKPESKDDAKILEEIIQHKEFWINSQRPDYLTEVNVGNWSEVNTRQMAREVGCEDFYKFVYVPFSSAAHSMWQHVGRFNLKQCSNPLHKFHKTPRIPDHLTYPEHDYLYNSAKYMTKSLASFDKKYNINPKNPMPLDWFVEEFNKLIDDEDNGE